MNNMTRTITLSFALAAVCCTLPTLAQQSPMNPAAPGPLSFAAFDLDGDGSLTEQEFNEARANRIKERSQQGYPMRNLANAPAFSDIDLNRDGLVSTQEFATAQTRHQQQMMPSMPPAR